MREQFIQKRFRESSQRQIDQANEIIEEYESNDIQLTLRQLYYQFVARDLLANTQNNYKNLGEIISAARLAGLVDWSAIEDLGRVPSVPQWDENMETFIDSMKDIARAYRLDPWETQQHYVEIHVEKQALSSVLGPIADEYGIPFSMNKGYSSQTAFRDASKRFIRATNNGKTCVCLYAGDHDPSGLDMDRDFTDRMSTFGAEVKLRRIALTRAQIRQYRCPPNPAKENDARAVAYIAEHGAQSWEVDALDPLVLRRIAVKEITALIQPKPWAAVAARQERERETITAALENIV